jgi:hypothetical protein
VSQIAEYFTNSPAQLAALWVVAGFLVLTLFLWRPRTLVLATNENGRLEISRHALHRLLEACCQQLKGVASARARVARRHGKFKTRLRLKVRPDAKLDAIQGYLTQEIAEIYRTNLGITEVGPIEIEVVGIVTENKDF